MAKWVNRVTMLLLALSMIFTACASAESQLAFDGTVAADGVVSVSAPIGGTAEGMSLIAGQRIEAGDIVMTLAPELTASLLRYYWFRIADVMLPVGVSILSLDFVLSKSTIWGWEK